MTAHIDKLRKFFETLNRDSFGFKRSRRGTYVNPQVARDWKWFQRGAVHRVSESEVVDQSEVEQLLDRARQELKTYERVSKATAEQLIERLESDRQDASRWRTAAYFVAGERASNGAGRFVYNLLPVPAFDIMKGSVYQHFEAAVDLARTRPVEKKG